MPALTPDAVAARVEQIMARPNPRHHNVRAVADEFGVSLASASRLARGPQFRYLPGGRYEVTMFLLVDGEVVRRTLVEEPAR